ncbi:MAG: hypothetical protein ABII12_00150 [Planctomycetota bacterium]
MGGIAIRCAVSLTVLSLLSGCGGPAKEAGTKTAGQGQNQPTYTRPYAMPLCKLAVALEPASHRLEATATLTITERVLPGKAKPTNVRLALHPSLKIDSVQAGDKPVVFKPIPQTTSAEAIPDSPPPLAIYELAWKPDPRRPGTLVVRYGGQLVQDVSAGEIPGEIHNRAMSAHIGEEGIFLSEDAGWYPRLADASDAEDPGEIELTQFELTADRVPGMVLVASGNRVGAELNRPRAEKTTWQSPFALPGMALVGGRHEVHQRQVNGVLVSVHLSEANAGFAPAILGEVDSYLRIYEPLLGDYPYAEFTVVENFFSSGFAFPGFTVLASGVIAMGPRSLQPGFLDHEMVHNWWGNGVFVSGLDGNWCEALTSYCTNYMHHVIDGNEKKARAKRRNTCYGLSRLTADDDKPLDRFGHEGGPDRLIGYDKGAMVFAMLARKIGQDKAWRALKRLYTQRLGKPTTWKHIQQAFEVESDQSLQVDFDRWVRGTGIPDITIDEASYDAATRRLEITTSQNGRHIFDLNVPLCLVYEDGVSYRAVQINRPVQIHVIELMQKPGFVELDPDFQIVRRIPLKDVMPSLSGVSNDQPLTIVHTQEDFEAYKPAADMLARRYDDAEGTGVRYVIASELARADLLEGHVLFLGKACLAPAARELLEGEVLTIADGNFKVRDVLYEKPNQEVICCVRNEHDVGGVICFYFGNDPAALKKARLITFYGQNSIVVFDDGKPVFRQDFERSDQVVVQSVGE